MNATATGNIDGRKVYPCRTRSAERLMITFEAARRIALDQIGTELVLIDEAMTQKPDVPMRNRA